jgi:hypothetical protein
MVKAWLIVFLFSYHTDNVNNDDNFLGKVEIPYTSMNACSTAKANLTMEGESVRYRFVCVTDDHFTGKKQDKNVPFD